jgi:hypothetical protein
MIGTRAGCAVFAGRAFELTRRRHVLTRVDTASALGF